MADGENKDAHRRFKVIEIGAADRVNELITQEGITTVRKITEILNREKFDIGQASVGRYVKFAKDRAETDSFKILSDHIEKVLPDDLNALEAIERQCLDWASEDPMAAADRIAEAALAVNGVLDEIVSMFTRADLSDGGKRMALCKRFVRMCNGFILKDARMQDKRIDAMKMAVKVIETKLGKHHLLGTDEQGRIIIMDNRQQGGADGPNDGYTPFRVVGGQGGDNGPA